MRQFEDHGPIAREAVSHDRHPVDRGNLRDLLAKRRAGRPPPPSAYPKKF